MASVNEREIVGVESIGNGVLNVDQAVRRRYSAASQRTMADLCCPVEYDPRYLEVLPEEILKRDYGCGDPSRRLRSGETVLDLGSGGGKICYIASQIVGSRGRVIGVDANDEMLALARQYQGEIAEKLGYANVRFYKARIQDLALDLEEFGSYLQQNPINGSADWQKADEYANQIRQTRPMIADDSVDVVVSNCVLNLVGREDRARLFAEVFRVLRRGGRAVISDVACDEPVPERLQRDAKLWSGCISGAFVEEEFLDAFASAGFYGIQIVDRQHLPWAVVEGIEFRSITIEAFKGKEGPGKDHAQAVIYRGPWKSVADDDGHVLRRGVRTAVCKKTFEIYNRPPYADDILSVPPLEEVPECEAADFDCRRGEIRRPAETKGVGYDKTQLPGDDCCGSSDCC